MDKKKIVNRLARHNQVEAILLYSPQNRYWFSRFPSSMGYILTTTNKNYLFLDGRYITAARKNPNLQNIDYLETLDSTFWIKLHQILIDLGIKKLGFESDWVTCKEAFAFEQHLPDIHLKAIDSAQLRIIKDSWEVAQIKEACNITNKVFLDVLEWTKVGVSEQELARFVSDSFLKHGAQKLSFDTIVASGKNGALPHAVPTDRKIKANELVTLDMGCYYNGYASDQTRTFATGRDVKPKLLEIYQIVYEAQSLGIRMLKPGIMCRDIHNAVFSFIEDKGYGPYFNHGLGHGLGIEIHEEPYENPLGMTTLQPGMVVTVEPGIYIPGLGGVRIEDDFVITKNGAERLTSSPRELISI